MPEFTVDVECTARLKARATVEAADAEAAKQKALTIAREAARWRGVNHDGRGQVKLVRAIAAWPGKRGAPPPKAGGG